MTTTLGTASPAAGERRSSQYEQAACRVDVAQLVGGHRSAVRREDLAAKWVVERETTLVWLGERPVEGRTEEWPRSVCFVFPVRRRGDTVGEHALSLHVLVGCTTTRRVERQRITGTRVVAPMTRHLAPLVKRGAVRRSV
jgi:hypothetical protein